MRVSPLRGAREGTVTDLRVIDVGRARATDKVQKEGCVLSAEEEQGGKRREGQDGEEEWERSRDEEKDSRDMRTHTGRHQHTHARVQVRTHSEVNMAYSTDRSKVRYSVTS